MGNPYKALIDKAMIDGVNYELLGTSIFNLHGFNKEEVQMISVDDLLTVYPELHQCGETNEEFADKIRRAAEWNRGNDADTDLISRLHPDVLDDEGEDELQVKRNEQGGN